MPPTITSNAINHFCVLFGSLHEGNTFVTFPEPGVHEAAHLNMQMGRRPFRLCLNLTRQLFLFAVCISAPVGLRILTNTKWLALVEKQPNERSHELCIEINLWKFQKRHSTQIRWCAMEIIQNAAIYHRIISMI